MVDAAHVARLRNLLTQAQELASRVRAADLQADPGVVLPLVVELARMVRRFMTVAQQLPAECSDQETQKASWMQRGHWLQEDMVALAHERVWAADAKDMSGKLLLLLFCAADACDRALREKAEVEMTLRHSQQQLAHAQARSQHVEQLHAQLQAQAAELLEARSQVAVFQQQLAQQPELNRRRQQLEVEANTLRQQLQDCHRQVAEQQQAIKLLMSQAEHMGAAHGRPGATPLGSMAHAGGGQSANEDVLRSSLEANARVMEKLIALNEELMHRYNVVAAKGARAAAEARVALQQAGEATPQGLPSSSIEGPAMQAAAAAQPDPHAAASPTFADAFSAFLKD